MSTPHHLLAARAAADPDLRTALEALVAPGVRLGDVWLAVRRASGALDDVEDLDLSFVAAIGLTDLRPLAHLPKLRTLRIEFDRARNPTRVPHVDLRFLITLPALRAVSLRGHTYGIPLAGRSDSGPSLERNLRTVTAALAAKPARTDEEEGWLTAARANGLEGPARPRTLSPQAKRAMPKLRRLLGSHSLDDVRAAIRLAASMESPDAFELLLADVAFMPDPSLSEPFYRPMALLGGEVRKSVRGEFREAAVLMLLQIAGRLDHVRSATLTPAELRDVLPSSAHASLRQLKIRESDEDARVRAAPPWPARSFDLADLPTMPNLTELAVGYPVVGVEHLKRQPRLARLGVRQDPAYLRHALDPSIHLEDLRK